MRELFLFLSAFDTDEAKVAPESAREVTDILSRTIPIVEGYGIFPGIRAARSLLERCVLLLKNGMRSELHISDDARSILNMYSGRDIMEALIKGGQALKAEDQDFEEYLLRSKGSGLSHDSAKSRFIYELPRRKTRRRKSMGDVIASLPFPSPHQPPPSSAPPVEPETTPFQLEAEMDERVSSPGSDHGSIEHDGDYENLETVKRAVQQSCDLLRCHYALLDLYLQSLITTNPTEDESDLQMWVEDQATVNMWEIYELSAAPSFVPVVNLGYQYLAPYIGISLFGSVDSNTLIRALKGIESLYLPNPYHNSRHAAQVMHSAVWLAQVIMASDFVVHERIGFALACLGHDVGHPARTNGYLTATQNPVAVVYNDVSVLENYHCSLLFALLMHPMVHLFEGVDGREFFDVRRLILACILATDMSSHFRLLSEWRTKMSDGFDAAKQDKTLLFKLIIKAGDLSHGAVSWSGHEKWSQLVAREFALQGLEEERSGLPVSPIAAETSSFAKNQIGFLKLLVAPLYNELAKLDDSARIREECCKLIDENAEQWERQSVSAPPHLSER